MTMVCLVAAADTVQNQQGVNDFDKGSSPCDLDYHIEFLLKDLSLPTLLRTVISFLVEDRKRSEMIWNLLTISLSK
ncbi:unnamed protein product [Heligmosomoides polygyrus]|uniref:Uncharacterized protein n=1 Tax=Heligmosomoides polygyrus TaxID=6339 RepID=A0A183FWU4_HELPZ|nr:unnamed protein product [Heligmosomoides polygyrus]